MVTSAVMTSGVRKGYVVLAWLAFLWAVANAVYVYLIAGGARTYRVESAAYVLAGVLAPLVFRRVDGERGVLLADVETRSLLALALGLWLLVLGPFMTLPFLGDDYVFLARYRHLPDVTQFGQFFR